MKIVHGPAAEIEQAGPRDDRGQSWPHPRVGLDGSPWFRVSGDVVLAGHAASRAVA